MYTATGIYVYLFRSYVCVPKSRHEEIRVKEKHNESVSDLLESPAQVIINSCEQLCRTKRQVGQLRITNTLFMLQKLPNSGLRLYYFIIQLRSNLQFVYNYKQGSPKIAQPLFLSMFVQLTTSLKICRYFKTVASYKFNF